MPALTAALSEAVPRTMAGAGRLGA